MQEYWNSIHTVLEIIKTMLMTVTNILVPICLLFKMNEIW